LSPAGWWRLLLAQTLILLSAGFTALTNNEGELGVPFFFAVASLVLWNQRYEKVPFSSSSISRVIVGVMALVLVWDAGYFQLRANHFRQVAGMHRRLQERNSFFPSATGALPGALSFIRWVDDLAIRPNPEDYRRVLEFLRSRSENIFVLADATFLYGVSGRPSLDLVPWVHLGLSVPTRQDARFLAYIESVSSRVIKDRGCLFVIDQLHAKSSPERLSLVDFPRLQALASSSEAKVLDLGFFTIRDVCGVLGR